LDGFTALEPCDDLFVLHSIFPIFFVLAIHLVVVPVGRYMVIYDLWIHSQKLGRNWVENLKDEVTKRTDPSRLKKWQSK
jgi:hypothetical protein